MKSKFKVGDFVVVHNLAPYGNEDIKSLKDCYFGMFGRIKSINDIRTSSWKKKNGEVKVTELNPIEVKRCMDFPIKLPKEASMDGLFKEQEIRLATEKEINDYNELMVEHEI